MPLIVRCVKKEPKVAHRLISLVLAPGLFKRTVAFSIKVADTINEQ